MREIWQFTNTTTGITCRLYSERMMLLGTKSKTGNNDIELICKANMSAHSLTHNSQNRMYNWQNLRNLHFLKYRPQSLMDRHVHNYGD
jgi:hypothetical protein